MIVTKLVTLHDEGLPDPKDTPALLVWSRALYDADDRFYAGLEVLLADSAAFTWSRFPDNEREDEDCKRGAWLALASSLPAGRRESLATLLRESGYWRAADQVPA